MAHAFNPSTLGDWSGRIPWGQEFETSLGNKVRPYLYNNREREKKRRKEEKEKKGNNILMTYIKYDKYDSEKSRI